MLPPYFRWHSFGTAPFDQPNSLLLHSTEVLRLHRRVDDGTWWVSLNNQRDDWNLRKQRVQQLRAGEGGGRTLGGTPPGAAPRRG